MAEQVHDVTSPVATFMVPAGVEYLAPHMPDWAAAPEGLLTVHAGDKLRGKTPEAIAAIEAALK